MNLRVTGLFAVCLAGCLAPVDVGSVAGACSAMSCAGCCDSSGVCHAGDIDARCGTAGATCGVCASGSTCQGKRCAVAGRCALAPSLSWGAVARGQAATRTIELTNPTGATVVATLGAVLGDDDMADAAAFTSAYFGK